MEYAPAGNNTGGVPRDNTAVQQYGKHPAEFLRDKQINKVVELLGGANTPSGLNSKPNLSPTMQRRENERIAQAFLDRGWNVDESEPAWHKLATDKGFSNLSKNMLMPMAEIAVDDGLASATFKGLGAMNS